MANAKERRYSVRFNHPNYPPVDIDALTPERAVNSVALMHPAFAVHLDGVEDVATGEYIQFIGRCSSKGCGTWIRSTDRYIDAPDRKSFQCGECRPNARYNFERARGAAS